MKFSLAILSLGIAMAPAHANQHADAIYVLPGGLRDRSPKAAELFRNGVAPEVWFPQTDPASGYNEAQVSSLESFGVPRSAIRVLRNGVTRSTAGDALVLRNYVEEHHPKRVVIVTSWSHGPRASWVVERVLAGTGTEYEFALAEKTQSRRAALDSMRRELLKWGYYLVRYGLGGFPAPSATPMIGGN